MKLQITKLMFAAGLLLALAGTAVAQAPSYMNYQGKLTLSDGTPLNAGNHVLELNIYDQPTGGNLIWGPFRFDGTIGAGKAPHVTVLSDGRFNVILGPNDTAGRLLTSAFSNGSGSRFFELKVNGGAPMLPRQQCLTNPFVANANRADDASNSVNLNNKPPSEYGAGYNGLATFGVPAGTIVMWYGATPPAGWAECDGSAGRPDLRGRLPIGANGTYPVQTSGGASTHTHSWSATSGGPSTTEGYALLFNDSDEVGKNDHTHHFSGTTGEGTNIPPYVSLKFIVKL